MQEPATPAQASTTPPKHGMRTRRAGMRQPTGEDAACSSPPPSTSPELGGVGMRMAPKRMAGQQEPRRMAGQQEPKRMAGLNKREASEERADEDRALVDEVRLTLRVACIFVSEQTFTCMTYVLIGARCNLTLRLKSFTFFPFLLYQLILYCFS